MSICSECGNRITNHKKSCSKYTAPNGSCPCCGTPPGGKHKKDCVNFKPTICSECGGRSGTHKKTCSKFKEKKACPDCGSKSRHKEGCPRKRSKRQTS